MSTSRRWMLPSSCSATTYFTVESTCSSAPSTSASRLTSSSSSSSNSASLSCPAWLSRLVAEEGELRASAVRARPHRLNRYTLSRSCVTRERRLCRAARGTAVACPRATCELSSTRAPCRPSTARSTCCSCTECASAADTSHTDDRSRRRIARRGRGLSCSTAHVPTGMAPSVPMVMKSTGLPSRADRRAGASGASGGGGVSPVPNQCRAR